jgi:nicotinamidase-related amidase
LPRRFDSVQDITTRRDALQGEGAMATVRDGDKPVLMVVDVQVGVMKDAWEAPRIIGNVARAVARARAAGVPVVWVQHADAELPRGSSEWQWVPELVPAPGESLIHKQFNSAFEQTALEDTLAGTGAAHIVLAGASSNWCIRATAYAALERGYDLTLLQDAHSTTRMVLEDGTVIEAATVIQDLNLAMTWLSYPGRRNAAATAEGVRFGPAA